MKDINHPDHFYYKWRTFSFAQGDSERVWRVEPFQISIGGPVFVPPPIPGFDKEKIKQKQLDSNDSDSELNNKNEDLDYFKLKSGSQINSAISIKLPAEIAEEFDSILNALNVHQNEICNAMIFVMENTQFHKPLISHLTERICECQDADKLLRYFSFSTTPHFL